MLPKMSKRRPPQMRHDQWTGAAAWPLRQTCSQVHGVMCMRPCDHGARSTREAVDRLPLSDLVSIYRV